MAVDPADADCWFVSASTGPFRAHRDGDPQAGIFRRVGKGPWRLLAGGLPDPLPSMPYALAAEAGRLFAGLRDGAIWETRDRGESWHQSRLDRQVGHLVALAVT